MNDPKSNQPPSIIQNITGSLNAVTGSGGISMVNVYNVAPSPSPDPETLAAAQARLNEMPIDHIPNLAPLPQGSRMRLAPNPLFVGREVDLQKLAGILQGQQATATIGQVAAATGLGGIGKTQLAVEFVHRYGQYFAGGVYWLGISGTSTMPVEIATCGGAGYMDLRPDFSSLSLDDQVRLVTSAWQSPLPRLLVFDNCEDEALLAQWRPPSGGARVLVTSRRATWDLALGVKTLALGVLNRTESMVLLCKFRPDLAEDDPNLDAIAEELGDLPLALHLAGSFLKRYKDIILPKTYLAQLRDATLLEHPSLQGHGIKLSPTDHELHVARTFALSYDQLEPTVSTDQLALALLARAAYFAPGELIPHTLLVATLDLHKDDPETLLQTEDALARLVELGLLEREVEGTLVLHRLLAVFVRKMASGEAETAQEAVEEVILGELSRRVDQAGYLRQLRTLQSHLHAVTDAAQKRTDERAANLCSWLGYYLSQIGDLTGARPYLERMLEIIEQLQGVEHLDMAHSLNNLGYLLVTQGDYVGARFYLEQALEITEKVVGKEHPYTVHVLNNLGYLFHAEGDYAGARPTLERVLEIRKKRFGEEHPDTILSLNNLGALLNSQGNYAEARPYLEQALKIGQKVFGDKHPDVAHSFNNLGYNLHSQGNLTGARHCYEQALEIRHKVLGKQHPNTALSLNNLGNLLETIGDLSGARSCYEQALTILEARLGPDHPDARKVQYNLIRLDAAAKRASSFESSADLE
jgi:tetratricopeptide (TPR) repeat protein